MDITLRPADASHAGLILSMQKRAFEGTYRRYQDHSTSPACETQSHILRRMWLENSFYHLILLDEEPIGALRVVLRKGSGWIMPVFLLPRFWGRGYAKRALLLTEKHYQQVEEWRLETIAQEEGLCAFYEALGYTRTGLVRPVKPGMDLVEYAKHVTAGS